MVITQHFLPAKTFGLAESLSHTQSRAKYHGHPKISMAAR
jgi:hypothetical protein